jgi:DNA-binding CsgD family transcriptional regulator
MARSRSSRLGDARAMVRVIGSAPAVPDSIQKKRKLVADWCRLLGGDLKPLGGPETKGLSPRHLQTLQRLLAGDSEKEIAAYLGVSPHTVHVYVKGLYRHFNVASRGELTARFVRRPVSDASSGPSPE